MSFSTPSACGRRLTAWVASVSAEYYGIEKFARSAPAGARLLRTLGRSRVRTWATRGRDGRVRVVLINDSLREARAVLVRVAGDSGPGVLERLQGPSAHATGGVTLAGQSFGSQTSTGSLAGEMRVRSVARTGQGYGVVVPASSAAMLTIGGAERQPMAAARDRLRRGSEVL